MISENSNLILLFVFSSTLASCPLAQTSADTAEAGGVRITLSRQGNVQSVRVAGRNVSGKGAGVPLLALREIGDREGFLAGKVLRGDLAAGLYLNFQRLNVQLTLRCQPFKDVLKFDCDVRGNESARSRGFQLRFAFPVNCEGWRWHDDVQSSREIVAGDLFENARALREWADLPEWRDKPELKIGYANRNFCTVLTGPVGLCLAVPLNRPCLFRTAYDARSRHLKLFYDFALSPDTRQPDTARFSFVLYASDPQWGFRGALARYYRLYPEMFMNHVKDPGQWMAFSRLSHIDNANEFGFGLQEGAPEPEYDDNVDVLSTTYFTHAGMFARIPNYDPESQPLPGPDVQFKAMVEAFRRRTGQAGMYEKIAVYNAAEQPAIFKTRVYGHIIAHFNLDPDLPYGAWHLEQTAAQTRRVLEKRGGKLDGFYYDGLTTGLNYRREHFRFADSPLMWDPAAKKPAQNNFFSACEFARAAAELLRPKGQITMMNGALGASFFVAPWLDVFGSETGLRISREALNYIHSVAYHKPFLTLLKGNYEQKVGHEQIELFMKRALAFGILPGFFDWPPSGLGPGGRYWDHPKYYERDRDLFRKYLPLCRTLARAGWEPVTFAHSSNPRVFVERFGPSARGPVWLTLFNEDPESHRTTLAVAAASLGLKSSSLSGIEMLGPRTLHFRRSGKQIVTDLELPGGGVALVRLSSPGEAISAKLARASEALRSGMKMREVDAARPPLAVHWQASAGYYRRESGTKGPALVLTRDKSRGWECRQWVMLFQKMPAPLKLTVRASADQLEGSGQARILCRTSWVSPSFAHYANVAFKLPGGTYSPRNFEFTLEDEHPLRAVQLIPQIKGTMTGSLKLWSIRVSDSFRNDYVVDPEFRDWYEPVPVAMRPRLRKECQGLLQALESIQGPGLPRDASAVLEQLFAIANRVQGLRRWIRSAKAGNGCRRVLRDLETAEQQVAAALLISQGVDFPSLAGSLQAAPGDTIEFAVRSPSVKGLRTELELISEAGAVLSTGARSARLPVPLNIRPGRILAVSGRVSFVSNGISIPFPVSHAVKIVAPFELVLENRGEDAIQGRHRIRAVVRNRRAHAVRARLQLDAPRGWVSPRETHLRVPAHGEKSVEWELVPAKGARPGRMEVRAVLRAGKNTVEATRQFLHIPPNLNLLKNPGFEHSAERWSGLDNRVRVDSSESRSGKASVRLKNSSESERSQLSQTIHLNQKTPCAVLVRAASRAKNVSGRPGRGYSLYIDIYYTDGTPLYGCTFDFQTGTTDWQFGELYIEPTKAIRNINVYLLLRGKAGTVWFDDIAVMEDPRRRGNLATRAAVAVDSFFKGYDVEPINDGILFPPADAHWTDEAWASAEKNQEHFVTLRFPAPQTVARAIIHWSRDAGIPRTSREIKFQAKEKGGWRTLAAARPPGLSPETVLIPTEPIQAREYRFLQRVGRGPKGRPNLMWVREVELFPSAAGER